MTAYEFIEAYHTDLDDSPLLEREFNPDDYDSLQSCAEENIGCIPNDQQFCDAEWNFFHWWRDNKGFTTEDWEYIEACGYEDEQFGGR